MRSLPSTVASILKFNSWEYDLVLMYACMYICTQVIVQFCTLLDTLSHAGECKNQPSVPCVQCV